MSRPRQQFPVASKRLRQGTWRIRWSYNKKLFEMSLGKISEKKAENLRLEIQLALRTDEWPEWTAGVSAVKRFREGHTPVTGDLIKDYQEHIEAARGGPTPWTRQIVGFINELLENFGPLEDITPADAEKFLNRILKTPGPFQKGKGKRSIVSRNHARKIMLQFYKWGISTRGLTYNPFSHTRKLREPDREDIPHLSNNERDEILSAADNFPDGIATWIALLAGLRREEIKRLEWEDILLDQRKLIIKRSKTGKRRTIDLATRLRKRLQQIPKKQRQGRVVPWREKEGQWQYDASQLLKNLKKSCPDIDGKFIRWNIFRHTFCSLLAQAGISVRKISAWSGHSILICIKYYAGMNPSFDSDIDAAG